MVLRLHSTERRSYPVGGERLLHVRFYLHMTTASCCLLCSPVRAGEPGAGPVAGQPGAVTAVGVRFGSCGAAAASGGGQERRRRRRHARQVGPLQGGVC